MTLSPTPRPAPILMTVPVAGEGVRIRPDTATWDAEMRDLPVDPGPLQRLAGTRTTGSGDCRLILARRAWP